MTIECACVVIGRNEGERLRRCLTSLSQWTVVYVDSGSSDGSARLAADLGAEVVELDPRVPFTAGRARNEGFNRLGEILLEAKFVQFVDGDCEISSEWMRCGLTFLEAHKSVGVVVGRVRELYPNRSIFNWLCDVEWRGAIGEVRSCGGIAMMRTSAFKEVGGFRDELIAGEEPELCVRLRGRGWRIWRIDAAMASHDANMTRFSQWWQRSVRTGYAFAEGAHLHGATPERHWVWESRRARLWGLFLPFGCVMFSALFWPWGSAAWLIFPLQLMRQILRSAGSLGERVPLALFQLLARFPEGFGQLKFFRNRIFLRSARLIEYK